MVDDVFDVPLPHRVDRGRYAAFLQRYNSDQALKNAILRVSGTRVDMLPGFDDLDETRLAPFWKCVWKQQLGGRRLKAKHSRDLSELFQQHDDDPIGMLDGVVEFLSLFRRDLRRSVTVHGTDYDADEIAKAQIVVIDYFLGQNLTNEDALQRASEVVTKVVEAARLARKPVPSFLLVSSRPDEIDIEAFREHAKLMQSRFRFFSKDVLRDRSVADMVNLHDLIDASDHTEKIERLLDTWRKGACKAIDAVHDEMLALDVSDLVYLDCFRLTHEGTSISTYLRWFLTALMTARVTGELTEDFSYTEDLKFFSVVDENGYVDPATLVKTYHGPSEVIAHAYGEILFDQTREAKRHSLSAQGPGADFVEGDLFVRPRGRDRRVYDGAEVRLVMTPSCDLRRRVPDQPPSAQSVLLLPGTLKRVRQENQSNSFADDYFVRVLEHDEWRLLKIEWEFSHPISVDWSTMCDEGPGKTFKRLGRIRDLYCHRVRDDFANHLTRIGTEVAPLFPHPRSGNVFVAFEHGGRRRFESVMSFSSTDPFVWEIGPVRVVRRNGRTDKKYVYQASRGFVDALTYALQRVPNDRPDLATSAERSASRLKDMKTYMDLVRPMLPGPRGEGDIIDFRKAVKRCDVNSGGLSSTSDLLIVTFID